MYIVIVYIQIHWYAVDTPTIYFHILQSILMCPYIETIQNNTCTLSIVWRVPLQQYTCTIDTTDTPSLDCNEDYERQLVSVCVWVCVTPQLLKQAGCWLKIFSKDLQDLVIMVPVFNVRLNIKSFLSLGGRWHDVLWMIEWWLYICWQRFVIAVAVIIVQIQIYRASSLNALKSTIFY